MVCQAQSVIAQETCLIQDSLIHYTVRQDIRCLTCLINEPLKDSIIVTLDSINIKNKQFIDYSDIQIRKLDKDLVKYKKKHKNAVKTGTISCVITFLLTFFLVS